MRTNQVVFSSVFSLGLLEKGKTLMAMFCAGESKGATWIFSSVGLVSMPGAG